MAENLDNGVRVAPGAPFADRSFFGHPRGLSTLFFTELWERFSYYGMRALLILFITASAEQGGLGLSVASAGAIYGLYTAMTYLLSLPGGWVADRIFGQRRAVLYGGLLIATGNSLLILPSQPGFFAGLLVITVGTGLLKPNISTIVGQLYSAEDPRRDAGFSIFYMGINVGAFLAPLACGYLGQRVNWRLGFALAALGMAAGTLQYWLGQKHLGKAGLHPVQALGHAGRRRLGKGMWGSVAGSLAAVSFVILLAVTGTLQLSAELVSNVFGIGLLLVVLAVFSWLLWWGRWTPEEKKRLLAVAVLFVASTVFWCVFEQAGSTLNLFAQRSTDTSILGLSFPSSWFQSMNSVFIIALAPVFAWLWVRLGRREPASATKFVLGLVGASLGFAVLIAPAAAAEGGALVSPIWLTCTYLLHTCGELCLSPVGLSAMSKLAPARVGGLLMGVWFLSISVGNYLGGRIASMYESLALPTLFGVVAGFAMVAAVMLAIFAGSVGRLAGESKRLTE